MSAPDYIFIGGVYRSGTDLLRNMFNATDNIAICGETHYLGSPRLAGLVWQTLVNAEAARPRQQGGWWDSAPPGSRHSLAQVGDMRTEAGARQIVDYLYDHLDKRERAMWRRLTESVPREVFLERLLATDRSERSFFDLLLTLVADGRPIRGEKTPAHIHYVHQLLDWFPNARFVHMLRDPRAVFVSQKRKKTTSAFVSSYHRALRRTGLSYEIYMSVAVTVHWLRVAQLHQQYLRHYPRQYYALRFEALVADPEGQTRQLCRFLGLDFNEKMLQRRVVNSSFVTRTQELPGFDRTAIDRWREILHPATRQWISFACRDHLRALGYAP